MPFHIALTDTSSNIHRHYRQGIDLLDKYEVGLKSLIIRHNVSNITTSNNRLTFITDSQIDEMKRIDVTIPPGSYTLEDLSRLIQGLQPSANWVTRVHENNYKIMLQAGWGIDFSVQDSLGPFLGFKKKIFSPNKVYIAERNSSLYSINIYKVKCNLIRNNFHDLERHENTIFDFPVSFAKGEKIIERPVNILYYPIITDTIHDLSIRLVDQDNKSIDLHDNKIYVTLHFRPVK